jgi:hypothetical protein
MEDKENEHPSPARNAGKQQLRANCCVRLLSPAASVVGSSTKQSADRGLRRRSIGKASLSPEQAKQIILKTLGPSPSREALGRFVAGLSRDERRLFLGDSRRATPNELSSREGARRRSDFVSTCVY